MIVRIAIENLVLVERAEFEPGRGLTAVTGETGAGKTLLASAIGLLFGSASDARFVGPHTDHAWVEGEFEPDDAFWAHPQVEALAALRPDDDAPLVLARKVTAEGRSRALAWGRTVTRQDLQAAGQLLLATAGQHSQRRLLSPSMQRQTLDRYGGAGTASLLTDMTTAWDRLEDLRSELQRVQEQVATAGVRLEQMRDDLARIDAVDPSEADEAELQQRRERARHRDTLIEAMAAAADLLDGGDGASIDRLGSAYARLDSASAHDPTLTELATSLLSAQELAVETASALRSRIEDLALDGAGALDDIEDRLAAYDELQRRFGGTTRAVLAARERLREELAAVTGGDARLAELRVLVEQARGQAEAVARALTERRTDCALAIAEEVNGQLQSLGMASSRFEVAVEPTALAASGADQIRFLLAPGPSVPARPVTDVASGGELSRLALALHVVSGVADAGTIVFDEIDAGIGGNTAHAIGSLLRRLGEHTQVICITHLPQVAARAGSHVVIEKEDARTSLRRLETEDQVLDELCRMLGADPADEPAREHARSLRGPRVGQVRRGHPAARR